MSFPADPLQRLPRLCAVIDEGIVVGLHTGAQVYANLAGEVVADFGRGEARAGVSMTADTIMLWMSAGKPVTSAAIMQLVDRGLVALDDPIERVIPQFAANGKETYTLRHLLTHTVGLRWTDVTSADLSWDEIVAKLCAAKPERNWAPGERAGYHPSTTWFILAEVVQRLTGQQFPDYVRQEIFLPLGMNDSWSGIPINEYLAYGDRIGIIMHTDKQPPVPQRYESPEAASRCAPSGNTRGPMHDLGRFYQMLLGGGQLNGRRVLSEDAVRQMTQRQRVGMFDETFRHTMDWGLGLIIDSNQYGIDTVPYGYGRYSSADSFGHGGSQSSIAFADPQRQLAAAVVFNGMPGEGKHNLRMRAALAALHEDLGIA